MTSVVSARQRLLEIIDSLSDDEAQDMLDSIALWREEPDDLSPAEEEALHRADAEFERGEALTREEFLSQNRG
jgi:hypothetical protein